MGFGLMAYISFPDSTEYGQPERVRYRIVEEAKKKARVLAMGQDPFPCGSGCRENIPSTLDLLIVPIHHGWARLTPIISNYSRPINTPDAKYWADCVFLFTMVKNKPFGAVFPLRCRCKLGVNHEMVFWMDNYGGLIGNFGCLGTGFGPVSGKTRSRPPQFILYWQS
jgi:hypothetical protein